MIETNKEKRERIETYEYLSKRLSYNARTGIIYWKVLWPNKVAGTVSSDKRTIKLALEKLDFKAHRIAWILHYKFKPSDSMVIDHKNGDPLDNRISNLRVATRLENSRNCKTPITNKTGIKGVSKMTLKSGVKYRAYISINNKQVHLGLYENIEDASIAYRVAAEKEFGNFACFNR